MLIINVPVSSPLKAVFPRSKLSLISQMMERPVSFIFVTGQPKHCVHFWGHDLKESACWSGVQGIRSLGMGLQRGSGTVRVGVEAAGRGEGLLGSPPVHVCVPVS